MKNPTTNSSRLFQDRPIPETPRHTRRFATLDLSGLDQTDYLDSAMRAFLVLCLVGSMLLCGWQSSAPVSEIATQATGTPAAVAGANHPSALKCLVHGVQPTVGVLR